jgi:hypothetical protein
MRARTLAALALTCLAALVVASGCFVADELDASDAVLDSISKRPTAAKKAEDAKKGSGEEDSTTNWWKNARSINPGEGSSDLVRCQLGASSQFMRSDDCRARGGTPTG